MLEGKLENIEPHDLEQGVQYLSQQITRLFWLSSDRSTILLRDSFDPIFTLQSISFKYSLIKEILRLTDAALNIDPEEALAGQYMKESDRLRYDIASACPGGKCCNFLKKNKKLKLEKKTLVAVHNYVHSVEIKHSSGTIRFQLDEGSKTDNFWACRPRDEAGNYFIIAMNDIARVEILVRGLPLNPEYFYSGYSLTTQRFVPDIGLLEVTHPGLVTLVGIVDPGDYNGNEDELQRSIMDAFDNLHNMLQEAEELWQQDIQVFPSRFQFYLCMVVFHTDGISQLLPTPSQSNTSNQFEYGC